MAKKIAWTDRAKADVRAIDRQTALHLLHGLARFALSEDGGVKQLQGIDPPDFASALEIIAFDSMISATPLRSCTSATAQRFIDRSESICVAFQPEEGAVSISRGPRCPAVGIEQFIMRLIGASFERLISAQVLDRTPLRPVPANPRLSASIGG